MAKKTSSNKTGKTPAKPTKKTAQTKAAQTTSGKVAHHDEIKDALLRLRERITGQIDFLATDNLSRDDRDAEVDFRSEEQGTDNYNRDFALTRLSSGQDLLFEIDQALNRIAMGTYGICESCHITIEKLRIEALPYSRFCVTCQSRTELNQRHLRSRDSAPFFSGRGDRGRIETLSPEDE